MAAIQNLGELLSTVQVLDAGILDHVNGSLDCSHKFTCLLDGSDTEDVRDMSKGSCCCRKTTNLVFVIALDQAMKGLEVN